MVLATAEAYPKSTSLRQRATRPGTSSNLDLQVKVPGDEEQHDHQQQGPERRPARVTPTGVSPGASAGGEDEEKDEHDEEHRDDLSIGGAPAMPPAGRRRSFRP